MNLKTTILFLLAMPVLIYSCHKDEEGGQEPSYGYIAMEFLHYADGSPLVTDTMMYVNEAGNPYLVNEIQYFISDLTLHRAGGGRVLIDDWKDMHYVDTDLPGTHGWDIPDKLPVGAYEKISFTFGIREEKNSSLMFVNPPESYMFWPEYLGGGYHYMKLNGKWLDKDGRISPFDFHLGIGQIYDTAGNITGFIHNAFEISFPGAAFTLAENETQHIQLTMNVENWFRNPNTYDHDEWGGDIMQKQEAMLLGCENGHDVFSVSFQ